MPDEHGQTGSPLEVDRGDREYIRMHLNENLVFPSSLLRSVTAKCTDRLDPRYYPDEVGAGEMNTLSLEIGKYCNCSSSSVAIGVGGDQLIDLVFQMASREKRRKKGKSPSLILTVDPTFPLYEMFAERLGINFAFLSLKSSTAKEPFALDVNELINFCKAKKPGLVVLASPNNPTGIQYPLKQISQILDSLPTKTKLLLDEAYVEFADYDGAKELMRSRGNLVILRTFSKAFALASMRLGYLISANSEYIREFNGDYQYPYPVARLGVLMAIELLRRKTTVLEYASKTKIFRRELIESLQKFSPWLRVTPVSNANFVFLQSKDSKKIASQLALKHSILVRHYPRAGGERDFLRITVGSREINEKLLYALRRIE